VCGRKNRMTGLFERCSQRYCLKKFDSLVVNFLDLLEREIGLNRVAFGLLICISSVELCRAVLILKLVPELMSARNMIVPLLACRERFAVVVCSALL